MFRRKAGVDNIAFTPLEHLETLQPCQLDVHSPSKSKRQSNFKRLRKIFKKKQAKEQGVSTLALVILKFLDEIIKLDIVVLKFKFATWFDITLMITGCLAAVGASGLYPLMFYGYGRAAGVFIDYTRNQRNSSNSSSNKTTHICLICL